MTSTAISRMRRLAAITAVVGLGSTLAAFPAVPGAAQPAKAKSTRTAKAEKNAKPEKEAGLPDNAFDRGIELHRQGRLPEALAAFQEAEKDDKKDPVIQSWLGYVSYKLAKFDDAINYLNRALEFSPNKDAAGQANIHNNLGNAYLEKGDADRALESYRKAVELADKEEEPEKGAKKRADIHYNLGRAYIAKGDLDAAVTALLEAERRDPNDPLVQNNLGYVYERLSTQDSQKTPISKAVEHYRNATRLAPNNATYLRNLGLAARRDPATAEEGVKALQQASQLDKKDYDAQMALAEEYQERNQIPQAIAAYTTAASLRPGEFVPRYNLGLLHARQGNFSEAVAQLTDAQNIRKNDPRVLSALGWANYRASRFEEAARWYQGAVNAEPTLQSAHANLGLVKDRLGRTDEAIAHWKEALRLKPKDTATRTLLASAYLINKRNYDASVAEYRIVTQENPGDAQSWNNLGYALEKLGKLDDAVSAYQKAVQTDPRLAVAHNNLGAGYYRQGQVEKARQHYQRALQIDPNNSEAKKNLERLPK